jgi:hypothetical protein
MSAHDDRDKVLAAFGGKKGLIDSGLPSTAFLIDFNISHSLHQSLVISLIISAVITLIRIARRETLQHALSGLVGAAICAWFANRTGNPSDLYIPKMLTNLGYGTVYLIANLAGWPLLGLLLGPILGENLEWRKVPERKAAYMRASWLWVGLFALRLIIQFPIYKMGNVNLLGTVNLAMGYPLFLATGYGTWLILKSVPSVKPAESDD